MNAAGHHLVVGADGSIPAEQLAALGFMAGAHLRVVAENIEQNKRGLRGALPDLPEVTWEDFERSSGIARNELGLS